MNYYESVYHSPATAGEAEDTFEDQAVIICDLMGSKISLKKKILKNVTENTLVIMNH